ncbi:hypothetical protein IMG5_061460 [Ichthyophthirius multifiliis]|uniref:Fe2OG dioxygenase domain-containing protein n=1 Tax=Ichthyophthirius multifiliis TaxID=5932 RepID=G0QNU6_ICHMU|nr:hypothetical protein IMG5_061460 [Ichthyophthirius multifiliis]EGR33100.1 hypothetical protein IMG5_061460 [Ichthyophthirius multifiliis]|eukprot:XP_004037086.1 hypothetical protein IMG5_061460 [Ichthyophthirius multifiliis]
MDTSILQHKIEELELSEALLKDLTIPPIKNKTEKQIITKEYEIQKRLKRSKEVIQSQEKNLEIFSENPTSQIFLVHFGTGNESDDFQIRKIFAQKPLKIILFPGLSYAYIRFENKEQCEEELLKKTHKIINNQGTFYIEIPEIKKIFIFLFTTLSTEQILNNKPNEIPNSLKYIEIPGIFYFPNFITEEQENYIIQQIDEKPWIKLSKRQVQHYGYEFIYGQNTINKEKKTNPIPDFLSNMVQQLNEYIKNKQKPLDQLTINDYKPGNGISSHVDAHSPFEECIVVVSLVSGVVITFKSYKNEEKSLFLENRSLLIMSGEGRYAWTHCISSRKVDRVQDEVIFRKRRVSLTFRTIRFEKCQCQFKFFCEDQGYDPVAMKKDNPLLQQFLKEN